ncbi:hypothetical protein D3C73_1326130 [compost metagenome]
MLVLFQYHHTCAVAQHKTVTLFVPRAACRLRVIITRRQRTCCAKTTHTQRCTGFFSTTRNHRVCVAVCNDTRGMTDVMHA